MNAHSVWLVFFVQSSHEVHLSQQKEQQVEKPQHITLLWLSCALLPDVICCDLCRIELSPPAGMDAA